MFAFVNDWRLAKKLLVAFSFLALLTAGLALNGVVSNKRLSAISESHVKGVAGMSALADLMSDVKEERIIVYSFYNAANAKDAAKLEERFTKAKAALVDEVEAYRTVAGSDFAGEVDTLRKAVDQLNETNDRTFAARRSGDLAGTLALIKGDGKDRSHDAIDQIEKLLKLSRERSEAANASGAATSAQAMFLTVLFALLTAGGLGAAWFLIDRTVATPMAELTRATMILAEGGEANVPHSERGDELGAIAKAVEQFRGAAVARAAADA